MGKKEPLDTLSQKHTVRESSMNNPCPPVSNSCQKPFPLLPANQYLPHSHSGVLDNDSHPSLTSI